MSVIEPGLLRVEQVARDETFVVGLQMAVADPAWLLARQLQFGELDAHDAGTPVTTAIERQTVPLDAYLPTRPDGTRAAVTLPDPQALLEAVVEGTDNADDVGPVEAGVRALAYRRMVRAASAAATATAVTAYLDALPEQFPLSLAATGDDPVAVALSAGWAVDGRALTEHLAQAVTGLAPLRPTVTSVVASTLILTTAAAYLAGSQPATVAADAWDGPRSEYRFALGAATPDGPVVLEAPAQDSASVDWFSLDVSPGLLTGLGTAAATTTTDAVLPSAVSFPGMPAPRLWTMESDPVGFGQVGAAAEDVAAMLVVEFALSYSDEFYLVPLEVSLGTLWRVTSLVVRDTFGVATTVPPAAEVSVFRHSSRVPPPVSGEWSAVLPVVADSRTSAPREVVDLLRDELADRCWAVERTATDVDGEAYDVDSAVAAAALPPAGPGTTARYRLHSPVAPNWYPLRATSDTTLQLARLAGQPVPRTQFLTRLGGVDVPQEEITRAGRRLLRSTRYARAADGSQVLWTTRRATPAPPVGSPPLAFDQVDRSANAAES